MAWVREWSPDGDFNSDRHKDWDAPCKACRWVAPRVRLR
jgi:hypothetical protein